MKQKGFAPIIILVLVILAVVGYFGYKNWAKVQTVVAPTPTALADPTASWKTYTITTDSALNLDNYQVKLPSTWVQIEHSSSFQNTETFQDTATNFIYQLIINQDKNLNPQTKKPYSTLKEFVGLPYDVPSLMVDGQQGAQVQPRAGAETNYKVLFISKDNKATFSIELDTPRDGSKTEEGKVLFNQILSTFKFLDSISKGVTKDQAVQLVKALPEVKDYLKIVPNAIIEFDHESDDKTIWVVHVFEIKDDHTATFNWFDVNEVSGEINKEF